MCLGQKVSKDCHRCCSVRCCEELLWAVTNGVGMRGGTIWGLKFRKMVIVVCRDGNCRLELREFRR